MTTSAGPATDQATSPATPLRRNRAFMLFWGGESVSLLGTATTTVLLPLLAVFTFDAGPVAIGILTAASWLPWVLIGLPAGAWVDEWPPRSTMIIANLAAAATLGSVPVAHLLGVLTLPHLVIAALLVGTSAVFFQTAYAGLMAAIVPTSQLEPANARLLGSQSAAQIAGPGLGGLLAQGLTAAGGLALDALSFLASAICLWRIRPAPTPPPDKQPDALRTRIAEGVGWIRHDPHLPWFVVIGGAANFGLTGINTLTILFLIRDLNLGPAHVGLVMMAGSIGGLAGALAATAFSRRVGSGRASTILLLLQGPPALLIALGAPGWGVGCVAVGLAGVGLFVVAGNVIRGAWRQHYVPEALLGRVIAASQLVNFGTMPVAALAAGGMAASIGIRPTLLSMGAVVMVAGLSILLTPMARFQVLPAAPAPHAAGSASAHR